MSNSSSQLPALLHDWNVNQSCRHANGGGGYSWLWLLTYHTSNNDNGCEILKIGHIPPDILVDGEDEVKDPSQEGKYQ